MNNNDLAIIKDIKVMRGNEFMEPEYGYTNKNNIINTPYLKYPKFQFSFSEGQSQKQKEKKIDLISMSDNESTSVVSNSRYTLSSIFEKIK